VLVHLLPADRAQLRIIDGDQVCAAIEALHDGEAIRASAQRFSILGDPTRLRLLIAVGAAGPISVSDLAVATGMTDDHVSQTLRFLRASHTVTAERDGRIVRYQIADPIIARLATTATAKSTSDNKSIPPSQDRPHQAAVTPEPQNKRTDQRRERIPGSA
jgi:ArsR family transcriptional regulator, lead/cadmium/zinc/bismuth-responsive transcriptional repressor